jgi:hypothetical protein
MKIINRLIVWILMKILILALLAGCAPNEKPTARETIEAYYKALNDDRYEEAAEFVFVNDPATKNSRIEGFEELDAFYSELEIIPIEDLPESYPEYGFIEDTADVPGQCERFLVRGVTEFPSGWGAGPSGPFGTFLVLVKLNDRWVIAGEGAPTIDSCTRAMELTGVKDGSADK